MKAIKRTSLLFFAGFFGLVGGAVSAGITQTQAITFRQEGSAHAYRAAGFVLECLSKARNPKEDTKGPMSSALNELTLARTAYQSFLDSDRAKSPVPKIEDKDRQAALTQVKAQLSLVGFRELGSEGAVAKANIDAIDGLGRFISKWPDCGGLVKNPVGLVNLLEAKILLERTSQLAEAVWAD